MRNRYTPLQKEQIEQGKKKGLNVRLYAKPCFNYRQMESLKDALLSGFSEEEVKQFAHPWISYEEMESIKEDLQNKETVKIPRKPLSFLRWFLIMPAVFGFILLVPKGTQMRLELTQEQVELNVLQEFDPKAYVETWQGGEKDRLELVEPFTCREVGTTLIPYRVQGPSASITKYLRLRIVDHTAPELVLKEERVFEPLLQPLSCRSFVLSAKDETDGDLMDRVQCEKTEGELVFTLSDLSGNQTQAFLKVEEPELPVEEEVYEEVFEEPVLAVPPAVVVEKEQEVFVEQWESVQEWTQEVTGSETVVVLQ